MEPLTFKPFIPVTQNGKDFSGLEEAVRSMKCYNVVRDGVYCAFVRGSAVSGYDGAVVKAHSRSDVDITVVSDQLHRVVYRYHEQFPGEEGHVILPVDINNVNVSKLRGELTTRGERTLSSLQDFVADSVCVHNEQIFTSWRETALLSYLRLGLGYYGDIQMVTPSGAMKAISQGRLIINPFRWWSVEYAFKTSKTAEHNILRYYTDVDAMLDRHMTRVEFLDGEPAYLVPSNFIVRPSHFKAMMHYMFEKAGSRLVHLNLSFEDIIKTSAKFRILVIGMMYGKIDIDVIFAPEPVLLKT